MVVQASRVIGFAAFAVSGMAFAGFCLGFTAFAVFAGFWGSEPRLQRTLAGLGSCLAMVVQASRETGFAGFAVSGMSFAGFCLSFAAFAVFAGFWGCCAAALPGWDRTAATVDLLLLLFQL